MVRQFSNKRVNLNRITEQINITPELEGNPSKLLKQMIVKKLQICVLNHHLQT